MTKEIGLDRISPKIAVMGVGGAGQNAVDNMIRSDLKGVSFLVCNTDAQALSQSLCSEESCIRMGFGITQGLGAGSCPKIGQSAAKESIEEILKKLDGVHMLFVTAGMGGGTGTGASPVIAAAAREKGILTVGVVTKPFHFEGSQRMDSAKEGIRSIRECVDTLLVIPNQNLFRIADQNTTFVQAFAMADDILLSGVKTFTDLMINPGLVNCDFADICAVMRNTKGRAMMGTGCASGESRATEAAEKAIGGLLLDEASVSGARSLLINVTGGTDLRLYDVDEAIGRIKKEMTHDASGNDLARIIFGATFDESMESSIRVSVVATDIQDVETPAPVWAHETEDSGNAVRKDDAATSASLSFESDNASSIHEMGSRHHDFLPLHEEVGDSMGASLQETSEEEFGMSHFSFDSSFPENELAAENTHPKIKKKDWMQRITKFIKGNEIPTIFPIPSQDKKQKSMSPEDSGIESELPSFLQYKRSGTE